MEVVIAVAAGLGAAALMLLALRAGRLGQVAAATGLLALACLSVLPDSPLWLRTALVGAAIGMLFDVGSRPLNRHRPADS